MKWKIIYKKYCKFSGRKLTIGIKDWEQRLKTVLKWVKDLPKNSEILDLGCGIGIAGLALKEIGFKEIVGVDINEKQIKIAKKFYKKVYKIDCNRLNIKGKFNLILALNIIEHLESPNIFLKKIYHLLSDKGYLILSLPNEIWFRKLFNLIPKDPTHKQHWSIFLFKRFLRKYNFRIIEMKPVGNIPFLLACQTFMVLATKNKV